MRWRESRSPCAPWLVALELVGAFAFVGALALPTTADARPLSTKVTERVVDSAVDTALEALARPENQRRLATILSSPAVTGGVHDIAVAGSVALVTNGGSAEGGLWAIDLRQPSTPQTVGGMSLPAAGMRVAAGGESGLVGSPGAGMGVWRFTYE